jgi:hypothetical protein
MSPPALILLALAVLVPAALWVCAAVYIYTDASARKMPNAHWWAVGALLSGPLALAAYLIDRPKGIVANCRFCTRQILDTDLTCPYCGREGGGIPDSRGRR